ncbi:MAG TPA: hypothetical protein VGF99_15500, partial [Myxococcota bacterium]
AVVVASLSSAVLHAEPALSFDDGAALFMLDKRADAALLDTLLVQKEACARTTTASPDRCRLRGLIAASYAVDVAAQTMALSLFDATGSVAGLLPEQDMDGAYRGQLHLVPVLPVAAHRRHLQLASAALLDLDRFFARLGITSSSTGTTGFRWRPLGLRFFESVKRRTPSAFAIGWTVSYNVKGSLFTTPQRVRETFFHEVFHLNDQARRNWSRTALAVVYRRIVAACGTKTTCLTPYAPDAIKVVGGTYYAFMPDNGVTEYAADVAKRWYVEHHALLEGRAVAKPFKCGTPENATAWQLVVDEFFGGVDRVPPCRADR